MIVFELRTALGAAKVSIDSDAADQIGDIVYEGPDVVVHLVQRWLQYEGGAHGHLIGARTTPGDLAFAMRRPAARVFRPRLLEGRGLARTSGTPEDVIS